MANPEHVAILRQGVQAWNAWREEQQIQPDLSHADLQSHQLSDANFETTILCGAECQGADLRAADFGNADLTDANLIETSLGEADFTGANLSGANLDSADLYSAKLIEVSLRGAFIGFADFRMATLDSADFSNAVAGATTFAEIDLRNAIGLELIEHWSPSTLGVDVILRSGGHIPDVFLRGCGIDPLVQRILIGDRESMTTAFHEFVNQGGGPLRLPTCFISYSTYDKPFADRLQKALNASGVNYWYAPEHGRPGQELTSQIAHEIKSRDRVILVCSKDSLASDWVRWEIDQTREQEKERGKIILYPIMLDNAVLTWSDPRASRIREILVGDFRGATKGRAFKERFGRLMAGLRDEG